MLPHLYTKLMPLPVNMSFNRILVLPHLFYRLDLVSYDFWLNSAIKKAQNECWFNSRHITKKAVFQYHAVYSIMTSFMTLLHQCKHLNMVPPEAPYPDVYTDTFIFFLRPLCKIIWMNVHYFPNAPRMLEECSWLTLTPWYQSSLILYSTRGRSWLKIDLNI